jgi:chromosomal replication initiator protein
MQSAVREDVVSAITDELSQLVGPQKYRIWFKYSTKFSVTDGYLKIGVPNLFIAGWLENHYTGEINQVARKHLGPNAKVIFGIDPELSGRQRKTQLDYQAQMVAKTQDRKRISKKARRPVGKMPLKLSLDSFVVGSSNELAFNAAKAVVNDAKSPFNPLFIHGGYGVGKTHLAQGICNQVAKNRPDTDWLYLSAEDFANQFVLALKTKKLEAFRRRMRQTELLAIDDIHFLASKPSTQEEFLHTFNAIDMAGKQVVLVSDAHPKMIGQLSEKLVNRFVSGMVVKIDTPDVKVRKDICRQYAQNMKKHIPESVINYIAENIRSNVRELEGALIKVVAFSSLQSKRLDLHMAKEVLAEHLSRTDPIVHISDIESAVVTFFGLTCADIHSSKKDRTISLARHFSMYLARQHTNMSSPEIGRFMGGKNHATVLLACKKLEDMLKRNAEVRWIGPSGNKISKTRTVLAKLSNSISSK